MNNDEHNYIFSKKENIHILSDRIPINWKEIIILSISTFLILFFLLDWIVATVITILMTIGYTIFRFASWIYYSEINIDEKNRKLIRLKKILNRIQKVDLITNKFDPNRFEYRKMTRSGETKFLMNYNTHKNHELLIIKNAKNKNQIESYIREQIKITE